MRDVPFKTPLGGLFGFVHLTQPNQQDAAAVQAMADQLEELAYEILPDSLNDEAP